MAAQGIDHLIRTLWNAELAGWWESTQLDYDEEPQVRLDEVWIAWVRPSARERNGGNDG
jgi:hypothetical protein